VRLVIMHPQYRHSRGDDTSSAMTFALSAATGRGSAHRLNRNMVVFLAADAKRYEELDDAVRQFLAWKELAGSDERVDELGLPPQQAAQARKRFKDADETVNLRISASYHWLLLPTQTTSSLLRIEESKADTTKDRLAERASDRLRTNDQLRNVHGNIRLDLDTYSLWARDGHVALGKLWEYYCQYPYMPRLTERSVLERGIQAAFDSLTWTATGFALAIGFDEKTSQYTGLAIPHEDPLPQLTDFTLLAQPDRAEAQRNTERAAAEAARAAAEAERARRAAEQAGAASSGTGGDQEGGTAGTGPVATGTGGLVPGGDTPGGSMPGPVVARGGGPTPPGPTPPPSSPAPKNTRFYGTVRLDPERFGRDLNRLYQEVIQHLAAPDGVDLEITVEIRAVKKDGYPDTTTRTVSENARTLKFDQSGFEDH
jgi:hypothetical protein